MQPRLGPKPFTPPKFNESESFDKVFSVPAVPGNPTNGTHEPKPEEFPKIPEKDKSPTSDLEQSPTHDSDFNGKIIEEDNNDDSGYVPKTPSTAERRKLFEHRSNSNENEDNFDITDQSNNFERMSLQRSSIAERRRMYENRSQSVQEPTVPVEKPVGSPVMLRRKDSFKNRKNAEDSAKDENNRKSVPFAKQQSLDPQAGKKSESAVAAAPITKRTSTVFGKCKVSPLISARTCDTVHL